jgi:predicted O-methyltransferase YrrM
MNYIFSKFWFNNNKANWDKILPIINPTKILEIGSYEGACACYLIEKFANNPDFEIHCVDLWSECDDISKSEEKIIEDRFDNNIKKSLSTKNFSINYFKHKGKSFDILNKLIYNKHKDFDLIYIDASHYSVDVLTDAVLSFNLLKVGGMMILDDYLWSDKENIVFYPKIAIDCFTNIFSQHIKLIPAPLNQIYIIRIS